MKQQIQKKLIRKLFFLLFLTSCLESEKEKSKQLSNYEGKQLFYTDCSNCHRLWSTEGYKDNLIFENFKKIDSVFLLKKIRVALNDSNHLEDHKKISDLQISSLIEFLHKKVK